MTRLGLQSPVRICGAIVIPVYWQQVTTACWDDVAWVQGERSAAAVVVKSGNAVRAFTVDGEEWDLASLAAAVPALTALLASLRE